MSACLPTRSAAAFSTTRARASSIAALRTVPSTRRGPSSLWVGAPLLSLAVVVVVGGGIMGMGGWGGQDRGRARSHQHRRGVARHLSRLHRLGPGRCGCARAQTHLTITAAIVIVIVMPPDSGAEDGWSLSIGQPPPSMGGTCHSRPDLSDLSARPLFLLVLPRGAVPLLGVQQAFALHDSHIAAHCRFHDVTSVAELNASEEPPRALSAQELHEHWGLILPPSTTPRPSRTE